MTNTEIHPENLIREDYQKDYGVEVNIIGDVPPCSTEKTTTQNVVWEVVLELLSNCVENRLPNDTTHATMITVNFERGRVTVEDNFVYKNPEKVLQDILRIRDSGKPGSTKLPEDGHHIGGMGIYVSTKRLRALGGDLNYYVKGDRTIGAVATWKEELG